MEAHDHIECDEKTMADAALKLMSWNCNQKSGSWPEAAGHGADVLLLQEATPGPVPSGLRVVAPDLESGWLTGGWTSRPWSTAVAVREGVQASPLPLAALDAAQADQLGVSGAGSLAAAALALPNEDPITVASIYASWEHPVSHLVQRRRHSNPCPLPSWTRQSTRRPAFGITMGAWLETGAGPTQGLFR